MKRVMLFVALILVIAAGCRKKARDADPAPSGNPMGVGGGGGGPGVMGVRGAVNREELEHALKQISDVHRQRVR